MNKKILIVDDDTDILLSISDLLTLEEYTVETTPKGEKTIGLAKKLIPDLILLDLLLSGRDGRHICHDLKEDKLLKKIPVVMMSAHPGADKQAKLAGANDFIAKPFEVDDLLKIVSKNIS